MRKSTGRKGFNLDYKSIAKEYLAGKQLKELAIEYGVSIWALLDNFKKLGIMKNTKRYQDDSFFSEYNKESCYWAGFVAADGWITKYQLGIELSKIDKGQIENFVKSIDGNNKISDRKRSGSEYSSIGINSKQIIKDLKDNFNIIPNKSLILEPPKEIPRELISHFIRGYIDGDGSIGWHKYNKKMRLNICSGSKQFLEWVADEIKINCETGNPEIRYVGNKKLYTIEFMGKQVENILFWIYKNSNNKTRLLRKYSNYNKYRRLLNEK